MKSETPPHHGSPDRRSEWLEPAGEGVSARVPQRKRIRLVIPGHHRSSRGIRLRSPRRLEREPWSIRLADGAKTALVLVGIGLLVGFSLAQLIFHLV